MPYSGTCPNCDTTLRFIHLPRTQYSCAHCGAAFLAELPDAGDAGDDGSLELVSCEDRDPWTRPAPVRKLVRVGAVGPLALGGGALALLLIGIVVAIATDGSPTTEAIPLSILAVVLPAGAILACRQVLRQPGGTRAFSVFRSVFAILMGALALLYATVTTWLLLIVVADLTSANLEVPVLCLTVIVPSLVAGGVVARLASYAALRHALVLGLLVLLLWLPAFRLGGEFGPMARVLILGWSLGIPVGAWGERRLTSRAMRSGGGT